MLSHIIKVRGFPGLHSFILNKSQQKWLSFLFSTVWFFLAKFLYFFDFLLLKWHSFSSVYFFWAADSAFGKKMIPTRNILFIFGIFLAQVYIFTQVESVELRFALAVVSIFQIYKKTYYNKPTTSSSVEGAESPRKKGTKSNWSKLWAGLSNITSLSIPASLSSTSLKTSPHNYPLGPEAVAWKNQLPRNSIKS